MKYRRHVYAVPRKRSRTKVKYVMSLMKNNRVHLKAKQNHSKLELSHTGARYIQGVGVAS